MYESVKALEIKTLMSFVLLTIANSYSFLQILFLGNTALPLDGNPLDIIYRRDLSIILMALFSKYLGHVRTNLNKSSYLCFYGTQLFQIFYYFL